MCMVLLISYHHRGLGAHGYRSKSGRAGIMSRAYLMHQVVFLPGSSLYGTFWQPCEDRRPSEPD